MNLRAHIFVSGKVQGVFFRSNTRGKALELGLKGWVRNLEDGRVEAVFEGEKENVGRMMEWVRRGPEYARVEDIEIIPEEYKAEFNGFAIVR